MEHQYQLATIIVAISLIYLNTTTVHNDCSVAAHIGDCDHGPSIPQP